MTALPTPVAYHIYQGHPLRLPPGKSYAYYLAGNGVFKFARNDYVKACIPVGRARVAGLPPLRARVHVKAKLPSALMQAMLADARQQSWNCTREVMYHIYLEGERAVIRQPQQQGGVHNLTYTGGDDARIICDVHSHHAMGAFFSPKDNADEQGFRFYAVMGRIFRRPEIHLRIGVFGDFWLLPLSALFVGDLPHTPPEEQWERLPNLKKLASLSDLERRKLYEGDFSHD